MSYKAFLVGANTKELQYSKNDVDKLANALKKYDYEITIPNILSNTKIHEEFINLSDKCQQTDTLVLYFSGHGIIKQGKLWFVLADDNKSDLMNTYNINNLLEELDSIKTPNKLVILDCCSALVSILDWKPDVSDHHFVLTASNRIEKAKEIDEFKGSFFTHKICEYLDKAIPNESEDTLLEELYKWLEQETKIYNLTSQSPIPLPNLIGTHKSFSLGKNISLANSSTKQLIQIIEKTHLNYHTPSFSISSLSLNPKPLEHVFVEPVFSDKSEHKSKLASSSVIEMSTMRIKEKDNSESTKSLSDIESAGNNILFVGKKESGKTTLLYHFQNLYIIQKQTNAPKIPVYLDFSNLPQGKNRLENAILQSTLNLGIDSKTVYDQLNAGNFLILIDNFEFENKNKKLLNNVIDFLSRYNKNRFILASNENLLSEIEHKERPFLGIDYECLYIYSFQRKQIKQLVDKWFNNDSENATEITKGIIRSLDTLRLPNTPLTISLLLIAFEHQSAESYIPINKASLIQMILELLLEKMDLSTAGIGEFDYRLKEALLSHIAYYMDQKENYKLDSSELLMVIAEFFDSIGREIPQNMKSFVDTNLIKRGILMEIDGKICFRFGCFAEYFIAQHMIDEPDFYKEIINSKRFLRYHQEIDYLTGKQRNNKEIIKNAGEILDNLMKDLAIDDYILNQQENENTRMKENLLQETPHSIEDTPSDPRESFRDKRPTEQIKDEMFEMLEQPIHHTDDEIADITRADVEDPKSQFVTSLTILASSLRNCELIKDSQFKRDYLRKCVNAYWHFFLLVTKDLENNIDNLSDDKDKEYLKILTDLMKNQNKGEDFSDVNYLKASVKPFFRNMTLAVISELLLEGAGTPSLKKIIQEEINDKSNDINIRILYTLLYADLGLDGFTNNLENLISKLPLNSFLWLFLFDKIFFYYSFSRLSSVQVQKLENLLSEMLIHRRDNRHKSKHNSSQKSIIINDLHRTRNSLMTKQNDA